MDGSPDLLSPSFPFESWDGRRFLPPEEEGDGEWEWLRFFDEEEE